MLYRTYALWVAISAILIFSVPSRAQVLDFDLRTLPALGFFPQGGNGCFDEAIFATYIGGVGFDFLNCKLDKANEKRLALVNFSGYLIGLNFNALDKDSNTKFINLGYFRLGPHCRLRKGRFSLGAEIGYGLLLMSQPELAKSVGQHGFDLSFTFNWTGDVQQDGVEQSKSPLRSRKK